MLRDAREIRDQDIVRADLCVVGAGAADLSVALEFLGSPTRVLLPARPLTIVALTLRLAGHIRQGHV
jgi:hypothetical protein